MKVEIIAIGDEVLLGQIENSNSGWMARNLAEEGIHVHHMSVVADNRDDILDSFQRAFRRSDVTLITGGLGPTHDDLTKALIAQFFDLPIVFRSDILEDVRNVYKARQLSFIEASREQAEFPEGATPIRNPRGTAPGIWIEKDAKVFAATPGVPYEMQGMMTGFIVPRLKNMRRGKYLMFRTLHTVGVKEAQLYQELEKRIDGTTGLEEILKQAKIAFLPSYSGVRMRLTVEAENNEEAQQRLDSAEEIINQRVGRNILGSGERFSMQEGVGELLIKQHLMLTVAESCTGGLLAKGLTDVPGSSAWFERGFITYSNEAKHEQLGVPYELIEEHGAVSGEVAEAMASGALRQSRAQVALSVTGIAGPTGGTEEKPVGLVYSGYADRKTTIHSKHLFNADRQVNRERSVTAALTMLVEQLSEEFRDSDPHLI